MRPATSVVTTNATPTNTTRATRSSATCTRGEPTGGMDRAKIAVASTPAPYATRRFASTDAATTASTSTSAVIAVMRRFYLLGQLQHVALAADRVQLEAEVPDVAAQAVQLSIGGVGAHA